MEDMDWSYEAWESGEPYAWGNAGRGHTIYDAMDPHVDLGCGRIKKGRIGIDRYPAPGVNIVMDLNTLEVHVLPAEINGNAEVHVQQCGGLPFEDDSIESIISHHALEHIGEGFLPLVDEVYRVLKPGGIFYAITPLFPSHTAVADADHCRYFMDTTWDAFCGTPGDTPQNCWLASFSVPYTKARFEKLHQDMSPPTPIHEMWTPKDARELRVALRAMK
jgi:SAM-dependent methyltransferase